MSYGVTHAQMLVGSDYTTVHDRPPSTHHMADLIGPPLLAMGNAQGCCHSPCHETATSRFQTPPPGRSKHCRESPGLPRSGGARLHGWNRCQEPRKSTE